jgi:hypothetical protein
MIMLMPYYKSDPANTPGVDEMCARVEKVADEIKALIDRAGVADVEELVRRLKEALAELERYPPSRKPPSSDVRPAGSSSPDSGLPWTGSPSTERGSLHGERAWRRGRCEAHASRLQAGRSSGC